MIKPSISDLKNVRDLDSLKQAFGLIPCLIEDLVVDLIQEISVSYDYNVTQKPVEQGFITDSRTKLPMKLTMRCVLTDPIENFTPGNLAQSLLTGTFSLDSWKQKRDYLLELKDKNAVIQVITPTQSFDDMMIESLTLERADALDALFFEITLVEVKIIKTAWTSVSQDEIPAKRQAEQDAATDKRTSAKKNAGKKPSKPMPGAANID